MGHARVIVVLKPEKKRADGHMSIALSETISLQQEAARKLENFFKPFANSRTSILAREAAAAAASRIANTGSALVEATASLIDPDYDGSFGSDPNAAAVRENTGLRYFPNLGILFGTADENGINGLRSHTDEVSAVLSPPEMSLIHPVEDAALAGPTPGNSWALERLQIPFLWDKGLTGEGVLIGH